MIYTFLNYECSLTTITTPFELGCPVLAVVRAETFFTLPGDGCRPVDIANKIMQTCGDYQPFLESLTPCAKRTESRTGQTSTLKERPAPSITGLLDSHNHR